MVEALRPDRPRLFLRGFAPADFGILASWFENEAEARLWGGPLARFPVDRVQLAAMLAETLDPRPRRRCWSALMGGELAGHAQAVRRDAGTMHLARIAVAPAWRRRGVGAAMVAAVIDEILADPEVNLVTLNVHLHNAGARALYCGLGFEPAGPAAAAHDDVPNEWQSEELKLERMDWESR